MKCIVNVSPDWGIGYQDQLLVSISADLKRFRTITQGKVVILGRRTLATFPGGKPLKNRVNLILSHDPSLAIADAEVYNTLPALLARCRTFDSDSLCVIGGDSVYQQLLPYCDSAEVTRSEIDTPADRFFPNLHTLPGWHLTWESEHFQENGVSFQYLTYTNDSPLAL